MRLMRALRAASCAAWAMVLLPLPAGAATPAMTTDMAHLLPTVWASATAYGFALIAAFNRTQK